MLRILNIIADILIYGGIAIIIFNLGKLAYHMILEYKDKSKQLCQHSLNQQVNTKQKKG